MGYTWKDYLEELHTCNHCKHYSGKYNSFGAGTCNLFDYKMVWNDYCSRFVSKNNEKENHNEL